MLRRLSEAGVHYLGVSIVPGPGRFETWPPIQNMVGKGTAYGTVGGAA